MKTNLSKILPQKIKPGDTIGIIAPANSVDSDDMDDFNASKKIMENLGYKIKVGKHVFSNLTGYGATAKQKAEDFNEMFKDPEIKMVWCAKGGNNSNSIFDLIDYETVRNNPKILCGFSDITSITNVIYEKTGLVTYSCQTFKGLSTCETTYCLDEIIKRFQYGNRELGQENDEYLTVQEGTQVAEGELIGGNLSLFSKLTAGKYKMNCKGKILFLEELGFEAPPAAVSNSLYYMKQNGVFDEIAGIWLGNYTNEIGTSIEQILLDVLSDGDIYESAEREFVSKYNFPIIKSENFGHIDKKTVIPIGVTARINTNDTKKIVLLEDCVK